MENNEEQSKSPKRKKIIPKKKTQSVSTEEIQKLLKEALIKSAYEKVKNSNLEIDSMVVVMEEFLKAFIIIGYDLDDKPICITNAKSQLDADALYTSLARLFISVNNQQGL
jgi:hypothetical protein